MPRLFEALFCVVVLSCVAPFPAAADPASPLPVGAPAGGDASMRATNAGEIDGDVVAVDYRAGTIAVQAGSRRVDIVVLPSTNIQGNDNFHTIADIKKGSHVQVLLSRRAGTFIAQIIRLH